MSDLPVLGLIIPSLNRADLLQGALQALNAQSNEFDKLIIIDNGNQGLEISGSHIECIVPEKNLGVAASWNLGVRSLFENPAVTHVMACNDDIELGKDQLLKIREKLSLHPDHWFFVGPFQWSVWVMSRQAIDVMAYEEGKWFDEGFFPAYFEDNDFHYRFDSLCPGRYMGDVAELEPEVKRISMTIKKDPRLNDGFARTRKYYINKWGGPPGNELRHPILGSDITYIYQKIQNWTAELKEHLILLNRYAEKATTVTEFGGCGCPSTWAILAGHPKKLSCYDLVPDNAAIAVEAAAKIQCNLEVFQQNILECFIDPTEVLFIDAVANYLFVFDTLALHASRVSQLIIIHGTVAYGHQDEFPDPNRSMQRQGVCGAILDFLERTEEGRDWRLKAHYPTLSGLTVLQRI